MTASHEPIIDRETWEKTVALREAKARTHKRGRPTAGKHLFRKGFLKCGKCGEDMSPLTYRDRPHPTDQIYRCLGRKRHSHTCDMSAVHRSDVDSAVYSYFKELGLDAEATRAQLVAARKRSLAEARDVLRSAQEETQTARERLERIKRDYLSGQLRAFEWRKLREELEPELVAAQAEEERLRTQLEEAESESALSRITADLLGQLSEIRAQIAREVTDVKEAAAVRAALMRLFDGFVLHRGSPRHETREGTKVAYWLEPVLSQHQMSGYVDRLREKSPPGGGGDPLGKAGKNFDASVIPSPEEEVRQERGAFLLHQSPRHLWPMVQRRLAEHVQDAARGAGLRVPGTEDDLGDAGEDDRARAHRAGLERDVEGRARQPPASQRLRRGADRQDLRVGSRVGAQLSLVAGGRNRLLAASDHGPDRDVAVALRLASALDRKAHQALAGGGCGLGLHRSGSMWHQQLRRQAGVSGRTCSIAGVRQAHDHMNPRLPICAVLVLLASLAARPAAAPAATGISPAHGFEPHQLVVRFQGERHGRAVGLPRGIHVGPAAAALRRNPRVLYAAPNYIATASADVQTQTVVPNDPGLLSRTASPPGDWVNRQWNFLPWEEGPEPALPTSPGGINAIGAWTNLAAAGRPGAQGITVAVLDTGIAYRGSGKRFRRSPDFRPAQFVPGYDFVDRDRLPLDENGHGTHVAGTIAEETNNGIGLTGLAYHAKLMPVRVLNKNGSGRASDIARGIRFAVAHGADVINMSFNFSCGKRVPSVDQELRSAYRLGVVTVASIGNLGSESCVSPPATGPRVIGVGGTTEGGCLGAYSLTGKHIDVVAPGGGLPAPGCPSVSARPIYQVTFVDGTTRRFGQPGTYVGTSMAAAHVSGVAAMVLAAGVLKPHASGRGTVNRLTRRLRKTARNLGSPSTRQGAGLIDAAAATDPSF